MTTCTAAGCSTRTGHVCQPYTDRERGLLRDAARARASALSDLIGPLRRLGCDDAADLVLDHWRAADEMRARMEATP